jgi:hypothetical protein
VVEKHLYAGTAGVSWSADGHWLAMEVWVPHLLSAVAVSPDGRRRVLAAPFCGDFSTGLAWEPGGDRIALGVPPAGSGCRKRVDLRVRTVEGGKGRVIARGIQGVPVWSPDGRWIAVGAEVMHPDGTGRHSPAGSFAAWSRSGKMLAVVGVLHPEQAVAGPHDQTLAVGPPGGALRVWDSNVLGTGGAAFSRGDRLVAYARWDAIVVRRVTDGQVVRRIPMTEVNVDSISWASDGRSLIVDAHGFRQGD